MSVQIKDGVAVNALAVLDSVAKQNQIMSRHRDEDALRGVRAAVAELVEVGNAWCDLMPGLAGGPEFDRLVAALASFGGAS